MPRACSQDVCADSSSHVGGALRGHAGQLEQDGGEGLADGLQVLKGDEPVVVAEQHPVEPWWTISYPLSSCTSMCALGWNPMVRQVRASACSLERDLGGHGAGRHEHRSLLAEQVGDPPFQPGHRSAATVGVQVAVLHAAEELVQAAGWCAALLPVHGQGPRQLLRVGGGGVGVHGFILRH